MFRKELLLKMLGFPEDTEIVDIRGSFDVLGDVEMLVSHPDIKEVKDGLHIPLAYPNVSRTEIHGPSLYHEDFLRLQLEKGSVRVVRFEGWGQS